MIIKKLDIENFGKFKNKSIEFEDGFNLIQGKNGDGKSTIMSFLSMIFYGKSGADKSSDILKSTRKKYTPWNGLKMAGAVEFESGGEDYRVYKEFKKSQTSDKTRITKIQSSENIDIPASSEVGSMFFDMSIDEFERSVFIGKSGGFSSDGSSNSLAMRIANLTVSGDENISQNEVLSRLASAKEELVSKNQKKGLLTEARNTLEELLTQRDNALSLQKSQQELATRITNLENEIDELENTLKNIDISKDIDNAKRQLKTFSLLRDKIFLRKEKEHYLERYSSDLCFLRRKADECKEIQNEISEFLSKIHDNSEKEIISDSELEFLKSISAKIEKLEQKQGLLTSKIIPLQKEYDEEVSTLRKTHVFRQILSALAGLVSVFCGFFINKFFFLLLIPLVVGIELLFKIRMSANNEIIKNIKTKLDAALDEFSEYLNDSVSTNHLSAVIDRELHLNRTELSSRLKEFSCLSLAELNEKINLKHTSEAETLKGLRNKFVSAILPLKKAENYEDAYSIYVDISQNLNEISDILHDIETISGTSGIKDTSISSVNENIEKSENFIKNTNHETSTMDKDEVSAALREKRTFLNTLYGMLQKPETSLTEINGMIEGANQKVELLNSRYLSICLAEETLARAASDAQKGLGSYLSKRTSEYLSKISSGKYSDVLVSLELNVETKSSADTSFHEWKYFSNGEIDKLYLALRLAATDIIAEKHQPLPIFIDDILSQYDDEAVLETLNFLKSYIESANSSTQILFFTCHNHITEMAEKVFPKINKISL